MRRSDLALLQERQIQHITGCAGPFCAIGVTADVDLTLDPTPTWHQHDFPLNAGDSWQLDQVINYSGSFSYDAGSIGGSGSDTLEGTIPMTAPVNVSSQTISAAGGSVSTLLADATAGDTISRLWWSPTYRNDARDYMKLPLDDATLEMDRVLSSASTPAPANSITETVTPSLSCAGGTVTVSGALSTAASGVPVSVSLDQSQISAGQSVSASTTTGANGTYSATLTVPAQSDGLHKNGSRANWGVLVSAPSASAANVATLVVTPKDCSALVYTGPTGGAQFGTTTVSATLTDKGNAAGAAGRNVTFSLTGGTSVSATTNASGVATASLPIAGPPRSATITASYAGAADLEPASTSAPFTVTKAATTTTVTPSSPTVTIGDPVTFTAHVEGPAGITTAPGGLVQFVVDGANFGAPVALSGGNATSPALASGTIGLGDHHVQAVYAGDGNFATSASPEVLFRVRNPLLPTSTTQVVTPSAAVSGQGVTLSADVTGSGTPAVTGSVTFSVDGNAIGSAGLDGSGHAALPISPQAVGTHSVVATYSGDDVYNGSSSAPATLTIAKADVEMALSTADDHSVTGQAVDFTASVAAEAPGAGTPDGTVQLVVDGTPVGQPVPLDQGLATFDPLTSLGAGNHTVAATYSGDSRFKAGSASATQHVTRADTTTSLTATPSPSAQDQAVTIRATVAAVAPGSGAPTGTVVFTADGDVVGAAPLSPSGGAGQATLVVSTLPPGAHTLRASYAGDDDYTGSDAAPISHTVIEGAAIVATTTHVRSSDNPSTYGELISFTATVAAADDSTPTGTVQFSVDGADFGDPVDVDSHGVAESASLASPDPGDHTVIAAYLPTAGYAGSGDVLTQTVEDAGVEVALTSSDPASDVGQAVRFTADVSSTQVGTGTPTGFVQFRVDGNAVGSAVELDGGSATSPPVSDLEPGSHTVTALYSGDVHFLPESASLTQGVAKVTTATTLAVSSTSPTYGDPVTLTATVTPGTTALGTPTGTVTFRDGTTTLATIAVTAAGSNGTAATTVSGLGGGSHTITAAYSGSPRFEASTSAARTVTVAKKPTTLHADAVLLRINPLLGINVGVLRATLTTADGPLAGQPVVFTKGAVTVCTATTNASGLATCTPPLVQWLALALGGGFDATYAGTANYAGSSDHGALIQ
ncbi:MAG: Ig-like domain repeat protein [Propionibacteriales bacterium]|nr:Ig-like domain repeat protein [Propionibacteriales bacterium]